VKYATTLFDIETLVRATPPQQRINFFRLRVRA
jgi:hypothetical protein